MEFLKYILIVLLIAQIWFSGILKVVIGLVAWTVVWAVIALIHNVFASDPWSYAGFWVALWSWSASTWTDLVHANIGAGIASLLTLASLSGSASKESAEAGEADSQPK
jgi:hypothetical protein